MNINLYKDLYKTNIITKLMFCKWMGHTMDWSGSNDQSITDCWRDYIGIMFAHYHISKFYFLIRLWICKKFKLQTQLCGHCVVTVFQLLDSFLPTRSHNRSTFSSGSNHVFLFSSSCFSSITRYELCLFQLQSSFCLDTLNFYFP